MDLYRGALLLQHPGQEGQEFRARVEALRLPRHHMFHPADESSLLRRCLSGKLHYERQLGGQGRACGGRLGHLCLL